MAGEHEPLLEKKQPSTEEGRPAEEFRPLPQGEIYTLDEKKVRAG
jgi:hypothetical protein